MRRQRRRQNRIEQHQIRLGFRAPDPELLALWPGKDVGRRRLRTRPRRRRHHDLLQRRLRQRIDGKRIMHRILAGGGTAGRDLGDIQRRTAADADHEIGADSRRAGRVDMRELWLAGKIGEHAGIDTFMAEAVDDPSGEAGLGEKAVYDERRRCCTLRFRRRADGRMDIVRQADFGNEGSGKGQNRLPVAAG
ncbi:hypothetical protein D3C87_1637410 [compost metagenome]